VQAWLLSDPTASWTRCLAVECGVWLAEAGLLLASARRDPVLIVIMMLTTNTGSCLAGVGMSQLGW
jgi:hypothetical protein